MPSPPASHGVKCKAALGLVDLPILKEPVASTGNFMDGAGRRDLGNSLGTESQPLRSNPEDQHANTLLLTLVLSLGFRPKLFIRTLRSIPTSHPDQSAR